jgi:predicted small lipoprotein YifL
MSAPNLKTKLPPCLAALALAAVALFAVTGCGSSGPDEATGKETAADVIVKSRDTVTKTEGEVATGQYPNGHDTDEESLSGAKPIKPCSLVSEARADRILGGGVTVSEHLQGPTCVYKGSGREVTVVLMEAPLKPLVAGARKAQELSLDGRSAWCLSYETTSVVADVGDGRILQVTGACPAAASFAEAALSWF